MDLPTAWYDEWTRSFPTGPGSKFAAVFGTTLDDFQYSGVNRTLRLGGQPLQGFVATLTPAGARVVARNDDGQPAITEHGHGRGTAVILGCEASGNCHRPGNISDEERLRPMPSQRSPDPTPVTRPSSPAWRHPRRTITS
ncbi:MAG: hypothetical protein HZC55_09535 [Verrucomicrobia bacterium]|nr:hypothetical protein [Verrucomicrobiota bacterium]